MYRRHNNWYCCNKCNNMQNEENLADVLEDKCNSSMNLSAYDNNDHDYDDDDCKCGYENNMPVFPENPTLAQSYVPIQYMDKTFKPCVGLKMGTIFPELVSPYKPCQSIEEIEFIKATNKIGKGCNK